MHVETHQEHHHHEMPTSGSALTGVAISATLHCLTGCAIGEIAGMAIGTAAGLSNGATVALSIALAFLFGYGLTSLPLLRAGLALAAVIPIALASDTLSIATMELVDNAIIVAIPGAMAAGLDSLLFWGSLAFALAVAGAFAVPVNRWLIARGKGHAVVHETGIHGGPPVRVVAWVAAIAFVFGSAVLIAEVLDEDAGMGHGAMSAGGHGDSGGEHAAAPVRGLSVSEGGMTLDLARSEAPAGRAVDLSFVVRDRDGRPVTDYEVAHARRMHLIVVRRDLTGFQHLHPTLGSDGAWRVRLTLPDPGSYRVFADFRRDGENATLAADLAVDGAVDWQALPAPTSVAGAGDGYRVRVGGTASRAGREAELRFAVTRNGRPVRVEPYLGAGGHLVALREGDLAYLHVHPEGAGTTFMTEFPTAGRYRLFLQFKHEGRVRTAAFTRAVTR
ncbi:MAG TPA: DUF4396 domain-containing protein [Thermoleophilaceae bacterium]|nr:DUF4396 domain-containing protein [Thermoleophilaceae bacterium]